MVRTWKTTRYRKWDTDKQKKKKKHLRPVRKNIFVGVKSTFQFMGSRNGKFLRPEKISSTLCFTLRKFEAYKELLCPLNIHREIWSIATRERTPWAKTWLSNNYRKTRKCMFVFLVMCVNINKAATNIQFTGVEATKIKLLKRERKSSWKYTKGVKDSSCCSIVWSTANDKCYCDDYVR